MNKKDNLLIISLDAMSDEELNILKESPNFKKLLAKGILTRQVESVFLTNTYPVHTSVITGSYPKRHGIIENKEKNPEGVGKPWYWYRKSINITTLYNEAGKKGMKIASIL